MAFQGEVSTDNSHSGAATYVTAGSGIGEASSQIASMVEIFRDVEMSSTRFTDHFEGFHELEVVRQIFGSGASETLERLNIEFSNNVLYMRVDDYDGHLIIKPTYFSAAELAEIYLDVIHELVHVNQFMNGRISSQEVNYIKRPLEIEAYAVTVKEARALGLNEYDILDYLDSDLVNKDELKQLATTLGIRLIPDFFQ